MAKPMSGKQTVSLEEVVVSQAFEFEALLNVLERRSVITRGEVLEEIMRLKERTPKAR